MATVDVRRANERFHTELDWLDSWHSFSFGEPLRPGEHPPRAAARATTTTSSRRRRLRHPLPPRHGDRHLGARRRARAPRQRGQRRRDLSRPRAAHERGHAASATPRRTRARPTASTSCRCGCSPTPTGIAPGYEQRDVSETLAGRRARPGRVGPRTTTAAITIHQRDAVLWVGRLLARARSSGSRRAARARVRRRGRSTLDGAGRSTPATRCASPTRARRSSPPGPTAPRSPSGRPTPISLDELGGGGGGRRGPCRRSDRSGSTRPRGTRTTRAAGRYRTRDTERRACRAR